MKEATSELNTTVIVVIAIGALSAFFFGVIWPRLKGNLSSKTKCADAICTNKAIKTCKKDSKTGVCEYVECTYKTKSGNSISIRCPYKG